jgi:hypothetical protein
VQHEDVQPIDREIGESFVDLCADEGRRAVRRMAALAVDDELVADSARRKPRTDASVSRIKSPKEKTKACVLEGM